MVNGYTEFFERVEEVYDSANGFCNLMDMLKRKSTNEEYKRFKGNLTDNEFETARTVLLNFFRTHNTGGTDTRILGINSEHKSSLVKECLEKERHF